jgi:hypothetical protein
LSKTTSKAKPNYNFRPEYQHRSPLGPSSSPPEQGGGERAAHGAAAPMVWAHRPQLHPVPPFSSGAFNAT